MATANPPRRKRVSSDLPEILNAISGTIRPVNITAGYRMAALLVAAAMLVLPLVYLGIVLLLCYGLFWHATANFSRMAGWGLPGVVLWIALLLLGIVATFFLIKPVLAPREDHQPPEGLSPDDEPFLYDYVHTICHAVHAPIPRLIKIDCSANASISPRLGFWSVLTNDMVLTLGLPLVAGLTVRELSGVIAHELGHVAQHGGKGIFHLIWRINFWFARIVNERDAWDARLEYHSRTGNVLVRGIFYAVRFFVWLVRWIPWALAVVGLMIAYRLMRHMEFDSDRYEVRLAGLESFRSTMNKLPELAIASYWAFDNLVDAWDEGRLADDFPALIVASRKYLTPEMRREIRKDMLSRKTGLFDSHPSDRERLASARLEQTDGVLRLRDELAELPATVVFRNFTRTCKRFTRKIYKEGYGLRVKPEQLRPVAELLKRRDVDEGAGPLLSGFPPGVVAASHPRIRRPGSGRCV